MSIRAVRLIFLLAPLAGSAACSDEKVPVPSLGAKSNESKPKDDKKSPPPATDGNLGGTTPDTESDPATSDDNQEEGKSAAKSGTGAPWVDTASGLQWQYLSTPIDWCTAKGQDNGAADLKTALASTPGGTVDPKTAAQNSNLMACLRDGGAGPLATTNANIVSGQLGTGLFGAGGLLGSIGSVLGGLSTDPSSGGAGCAKKFGATWRMATEAEVEAAAKDLTKHFADAAGKVVWTANTTGTAAIDQIPNGLGQTVPSGEVLGAAFDVDKAAMTPLQKLTADPVFCVKK